MSKSLSIGSAFNIIKSSCDISSLCCPISFNISPITQQANFEFDEIILSKEFVMNSALD